MLETAFENDINHYHLPTKSMYSCFTAIGYVLLCALEELLKKNEAAALMKQNLQRKIKSLDIKWGASSGLLGIELLP
jgi:hypothetical protein